MIDFRNVGSSFIFSKVVLYLRLKLGYAMKMMQHIFIGFKSVTEDYVHT